jgi:hypothetical protein
MGSRADQTIVLITPRQLARADFRGNRSRELAGLWQEPRPAGEGLTDLVGRAIRLAPGAARKVWVLSSDLWTQMLDLPPAATRGVPPAQLKRALSFEAAPLSGIEGYDSAIGFVPMGSAAGRANYWITQMSSRALDETAEALRSAGAKLAGLTHPGGLPVPLMPGDPSPAVWQRCELWPDAIICVHGAAGGQPRVAVINADPKQERWRTPVETWRERMGEVHHCELLTTDPQFGVYQPGQEPLVLDDKDTLASLLSGWAQELAGGARGVPVLRPARRPTSTRTRVVLASALAAVALAGVIAHGAWQGSRIADARQRLQQVRQPLEEVSNIRKQAEELRAEVAKLSERREMLSEQHSANAARLAAHRRRFHALLEALAEERPGDLVVQGIESDWATTRITGICMRPASADALAAALTETVTRFYWEVGPVSKKAERILKNGGPWAFEIPLSDVTEIVPRGRRAE